MKLKATICLLVISTVLWVASPALGAQTTTPITVENAASVAQVAQLEGHTAAVFTLAFSPDSATLASGGSEDDYTVRLWDVATATQKALLEGHEAQIAGLSFNADGTQLETTSYDGTIRLWDAAAGTTVETIDQTAGGDPVGVNNLATYFTSDGSHLAYLNEDITDIELFDLATREQIALSDMGSDLSALFGTLGVLRYSDYGDILAIEEVDGGPIHLIDINTGTETGTLERSDPNSMYFTAIAISADGKSVAAADDTSSNIQLWNVETGEPTFVLTGHAPQNDAYTLGVYGLAFNPDGTILASASYDGTIRLWDVATGAALATLQTSDAGGSGVVAWSPDGTLLASANVDGTIQLWGVTG